MSMIHPLNDQRKRHPDGRVIEDGETLSFNIALVRDAATTDAARASIDETVKAAIEREAKLTNQKPADWLASADPRIIQRLIEGAARDHVAALGGEGIARGFALDSVIAGEVDRAQAAHDHKFSFLGSKAPKFNRDNAAFLARERLRNVERTRASANLRDAAALFRNAV